MKIQENIPLGPYTTFGIGGNARYFCVVTNEEEMVIALRYAREHGLELFVLGGGSNVVISDAGFPGFVVKNEIQIITETRRAGIVTIMVGAGESWDGFVFHCVSRGYWGIENLSAIPGTVGAAPVQNIGAYGVEVRNVIESVRAIDVRTGAAKVFLNAECLFSYRDSFFKTKEGKNFIITEVTFQLGTLPKPNLFYKDLRDYFKRSERVELAETSEPDGASSRNFSAEKYPCSANSTLSDPSLKNIRDAVIKIRSGKFPDLSKIGTAGSFWKNPIIAKPHFEKLAEKYHGIPSFPAVGDKVKVPLAWILDNICDLKGYAEHRVGLFKNQPLVLVAEDGATADEIRRFAIKVASTVKKKTGIDIEPEVCFIG